MGEAGSHLRNVLYMKTAPNHTMIKIWKHLRDIIIVLLSESEKNM